MRNTTHAQHARRVDALLRHLQRSELPPSLVIVFHSRKTFFRRAPLRFICRDLPIRSSSDEVHSYLQRRVILVVMFDEHDVPYSWTAIPGNAIVSPGQLANEKADNSGRWYLRRYSGNELLASMKSIDNNKQDDTLLGSGTESLRACVERYTK